MSQRLRQLMVLMLIALQFAAPLVHAHIGAETGRQVGLHMHQLEAYSAAVLAQQLQTTDEDSTENAGRCYEIEQITRCFHNKAQDHC